MTTRRYRHIPELAETLLNDYRGRYGSAAAPSTNADWAIRDMHKRDVMAAIGPELRKLLDSNHPGARSEYRAFIADLAAGEPDERAVGPERHSHATVGEVDGQQYHDAMSQQLANLESN